jgi:hypothetical protein
MVLIDDKCNDNNLIPEFSKSFRLLFFFLKIDKGKTGDRVLTTRILSCVSGLVFHLFYDKHYLLAELNPRVFTNFPRYKHLIRFNCSCFVGAGIMKHPSINGRQLWEELITQN